MRHNLKNPLISVYLIALSLGLVLVLLSYRFSGDIFETSQIPFDQDIPRLAAVSQLKEHILAQQLIINDWHTNRNHDRFVKQYRRSHQICLNDLESLASKFSTDVEIGQLSKRYDWMASLVRSLEDTMTAGKTDRKNARLLLSQTNTVAEEILRKLDDLAVLTDSQILHNTQQNETSVNRMRNTIVLLSVWILLIFLVFGYYAKTYIAQRKKAKQDLIDCASRDALTGLPNRQSFQQQLELAVQSAHQQNARMALYLLGVDRFKFVISSLGHKIGDRLIQAVTSRIDESLQHIGNASLFRFEGDVFAVLIPGYSSSQTLIMLAKSIIDGMQKPLYVKTREFFLTLSCGISIFPLDGHDSVALLKNADTAMHQAKQKGGNTFSCYSPNMDTSGIEWLSLENYLRHALEHDELRIHYQPQIDVKTEKVVGMEALLRWHHPDHGLLTPEKFIPMAEESGVFTQISEWILRTVCEQNKAWQTKNLGEMIVAINISTRQFFQPNLGKIVADVLEETGLEPRCLELEITESIAVQDLLRTQSMLNELKKLGIGISIDDFGTGYSSLSYIKHFPVNKIKVDQSFIKEIVSDPYDAAITRAIITLGHSLSLTVVAEGVETRQQFDWLKAQGCDQVQGYIISKAVPTDEFEQFLMDSTITRTQSELH